ncbi:hypothetical protein V1478_002289 [Vespula squamosa]|uniref:Uncharacterized protein n=1 Tax=Vespula squamosa TaxID=30214 RepID=A0ABD2BVW0_VESSQ
MTKGRNAVNKALMKLLTSQILLSFRVERANGIRGTVVVEEGAAAAAAGATTTATGRRRREEMLLAARRRLSSFGLRSLLIIENEHQLEREKK